VARTASLAGRQGPPRARAAWTRRGHRFAADPGCWADPRRAWRGIRETGSRGGPCDRAYGPAVLTRDSGCQDGSDGHNKKFRPTGPGPASGRNTFQEAGLSICRGWTKSPRAGEWTSAPRARSTGPPRESDLAPWRRLHGCDGIIWMGELGRFRVVHGGRPDPRTVVRDQARVRRPDEAAQQALEADEAPMELGCSMVRGRHLDRAVIACAPRVLVRLAA
jgi:hypothetical protein